MLVVDNIIDYYEDNSGIYNLVFKPNISGLIIWFIFLVANFSLAAAAIYHLWTGNITFVSYLTGLIIYSFIFLGALFWSSLMIRRRLWNIFKTTPADKLRKGSYYELFRKSRIRHLKLTEIMANKYRALKLLEYWKIINYLDEENFLGRKQIKDLIDFIYKRKENELDLVILTGGFFIRIMLAVVSIFFIKLLLMQINISFEFGMFMLKGAVTFTFLVIVIRGSFKENRIKKLIEILEDIYFRV